MAFFFATFTFLSSPWIPFLPAAEQSGPRAVRVVLVVVVGTSLMSSFLASPAQQNYLWAGSIAGI